MPIVKARQGQFLKAGKPPWIKGANHMLANFMPLLSAANFCFKCLFTVQLQVSRCLAQNLLPLLCFGLLKFHERISMPPSSNDELASEGSKLSAQNSALIALEKVAREHGIHLSKDQIIRDYALGDEEVGNNILLKIADDNGIIAKETKLS